MRLADGVFLVTQLAVAGLVSLLWTIDDDSVRLPVFLRQNYLGLHAATQVTGVLAGLWQGRAGTGGKVRALICSVGPMALVVWWVLIASGISRVLVLLPASGILLFYFGLSLMGVAIGTLRRRMP